MHRYLLPILIVLTTYCQADETNINGISSTEINGLISVSDADLNNISGQTGTPEQLQKDIDNKSDALLQIEVKVETLPSYTEEQARTSVYNNY